MAGQSKSLWHWLGRQVGHVAKAIRTDPTAKPPIYRQTKVEEAPHPADPTLRLRRTTTDEVVKD